MTPLLQWCVCSCHRLSSMTNIRLVVDFAVDCVDNSSRLTGPSWFYLYLGFIVWSAIVSFWLISLHEFHPLHFENSGCILSQISFLQRKFFMFFLRQKATIDFSWKILSNLMSFAGILWFLLSTDEAFRKEGCHVRTKIQPSSLTSFSLSFSISSLFSFLVVSSVLDNVFSSYLHTWNSFSLCLHKNWSLQCQNGFFGLL